MVNPLLGTKYNYNALAGVFVSADQERLAEIIHDYNPELELVFIPPDKRTDADTKPYSVVHFQKDGQRYAIFHLSEEEVKRPDEVLTRLFAGDMAKHKVLDLLDMVEISERAEELLRAKEYEDSIAEKLDLLGTMAKSGLHTFRHDGKKYDL